MSKVPEFWGKDSPYHGDTQFLGTPSDHLEVSRRRKREERKRRERERERERKKQERGFLEKLEEKRGKN